MDLTFEAKATKPELKGNLNEVCDESNSTTKTKGDGTAGLEVTALSFTGNCKPCTSATTFSPYAGSLSHVGEDWFLLASGSVKFNSCFGVACKFGSAKVSLKLAYGTNMANNEFRAEAETLTREEGSKLLCGETGTWTANYVVSSPSHWFLYLL